MIVKRLTMALAALALLAIVPQKNLSANPDAGALAALMQVVDRWQPVLDGGFAVLATATDAGVATRALETLYGYGLAIHGEAAALRRAWPQLRRIYALPGLVPFFTRIAPSVGRYTAILGEVQKRFAGQQAVQAALGRVRGLAGR